MMAQGSAKPVYVITILFNSEDTFPGFLSCLAAQDHAGWRLVLIDNGPLEHRDAVRAAEADPRITLIRNPANLGFARAANQGLRAALAAGGDFCILFNNDVAFDRSFLRRLVEVWSRLGAGAIAPRIMEMGQPGNSWYAGGKIYDGLFFSNVHDVHDPEAEMVPKIVDFATGCCLGLTRDTLKKVGLFDESYFVYWEDVDLCMRLKAAGIPMYYVPEPSLEHAGAASSGGAWSPSHVRLYYRSYMQLLRKHFGFGRALLTMFLLLLREAKWRLLGQDRSHHKGLSAVGRMGVALARGLVAPLSKQVYPD